MKKRLLDILGTVIAAAAFVAIVGTMLGVLMLPGFIVGMWYGEHLEWVRVVVFALGFGSGLLWMWSYTRSKLNDLQRDYDQQQKLLNRAMNAAEELSREKLEGLMLVVSDFYEGSPITHHVLQLKPDEPPTLKIGDNDHMVEVDWKYAAEEGFIAALERARMEWQAEETNG